MHILPKVHAALATVLLIVSLARLELSRRATYITIKHLPVQILQDQGPDVTKFPGLLAETIPNVILGVASVFPFLLVVRASRLSLKLKLTTMDQSLRYITIKHLPVQILQDQGPDVTKFPGLLAETIPNGQILRVSSIQSHYTCTLRVRQPVMHILPKVHAALATHVLRSIMVVYRLILPSRLLGAE
jgi:hypothetical protein